MSYMKLIYGNFDPSIYRRLRSSVAACWLQISEVRGSNLSDSPPKNEERNQLETRRTEERTKNNEQRTMKKPTGNHMGTTWKKFKERPKDGATCLFFSSGNLYRGRHLYFLNHMETIWYIPFPVCLKAHGEPEGTSVITGKLQVDKNKHGTNWEPTGAISCIQFYLNEPVNIL